MPHDEPDETDPMMLVGVELPSDAACLTETAKVIAQELASMGFGEERILSLFQNPFYRGPHRVFLELGEERVRAIVREYVDVWGAVRFRDRDVIEGTAVTPLPVLDPDGDRHEGSQAERSESSCWEEM